MGQFYLDTAELVVSILAALKILAWLIRRH